MPKQMKKKLEFRVYGLPFDFPAILLNGDNWKISDELSKRLHFHNCLEIGFCHSDSGVIVFQNEAVNFSVGDITFIPRHVPHTSCSTKNTRSLWSYIFIDLHSFVQSLLPANENMDVSASLMFEDYIINAEKSPRIHFIATCLLEEFCRYKNDEEDNNLIDKMKAYALCLYFELKRISGEKKDGGNRNAFVLKPALEYIIVNYAEQIYLKNLASLCHLSETHFRRMFFNIMGINPISFINSTRIHKACILLESTNKPILQIAEMVGISSISNFNRTFLQFTGMNPHDYKKSIRMCKKSQKLDQILTFNGWMSAEEHPNSEIVDF